MDEYLGDQEEGFYFEGKSKLEQLWRKCIEAKEIILRNNITISALGHSQSPDAKNFRLSLIRCIFQPKSIDSFLISLEKHMLWVLIRSASLRHF